MKITTQDIGNFFRALGEQMINEDGTCAGAILDTPSSRSDIVERMTNRRAPHEFESDAPVAKAMVKAAASGGEGLIVEWLGAFGDIELPSSKGAANV